MKRLQKFLLGVCSVVFCFGAAAFVGENAQTVSVSADTASTWEMVDGASIRTTDPTGIRFTAKISEADYAALTANGADVSFGMVVMPYSYVAEYGDADTVFDADTKYTFSESDTTKVRVLHDSVSKLTTKKDGYYYLNAALTNIAESNYEKEFYARAYYSDGTNYYFTPDNGTDNVRSVSHVAARALSDTTKNYSASVKARLTQYATQYRVAEGSNIKLSGNYGSVTSVSIDGSAIKTGAEGSGEGNIVYYPQEDKTLVLASVPLGRYTAVVENTAGEVFTVPFYRASYVIRTAEDLTGLAAKQEELGTGSNVYIVVAQNIDYNNKYTPATQAFAGVFDGNGHTISNLCINGSGFLVGGSAALSGTIKNLIMDNMTMVTQANHNGGLVYTAGANAKFENVFIRGTNAGKTTSGLLANGFSNSSVCKATNCIVIDNANYGAARKGAYGYLNHAASTTNVVMSNSLAVTSGWAMACKNGETEEVNIEGLTKVAELTAAQLQAFATAAGAESGWLYDATTGELSLLGNVVFTASLNNNL